MSVIFGAAAAQRFLNWDMFKALVVYNSLDMQYDSDGLKYTIYAQEGTLYYISYLYIGAVPDNPTFDQAKNDTDKLDFEDNFKPAIDEESA